MIVVLCGGVGGSRFLRALAGAVDPARITAVVNTGDDEWFHGLYVSPDPDIVTYALAGEVDEERGWGLRGDTFRWLASLRRFGEETWFQIGDRDLATHLHRTRLLREGWPLSRATADIARAFGVGVRLLPMSDDRIRTVVETDAGELPFQRYLVQRHAQDPVRGVRFEGAAQARPAPGVIEAIRDAEAIFFAPSNPVGSVSPILAVPGVRKAIAASRARRVAISPIVAGRSLQPPAGEMMAGLGYAVDVTGVAAIYDGLVDALIIDEADRLRADAVAAQGVRPVAAATLMSDDAARRALATVALREAGVTA
ncbi:MAG: 2-phospho-L-lactate transferase [Dehalococcoidia bacterium]